MGFSRPDAAKVIETMERILERLEALEELLRAQLEHSREAEARYRRMFAALAMAAGNDAAHDD